MKNNTKKKIAVLYSGGRNFGGIEVYLFNLFQNIDKNKFDIELLSLGEWELNDRLRKAGHDVVIFNGKRISLKNIKLIGKYLVDSKFNLLVSQATVANAYARAVSLFYKIPNLVTVHSDQASDYSNRLIRNIYLSIERLTRFPTIKYIAVSKFLKDGLIKSGIDSVKVDVIYNGLDFSKAKPKAHKRLVLGSVGRLHHVKGFDLLLQAFADMKNKRLRLKIAGVGGDLDKLKSLAVELGISDRVEFVGFVDDIYEFLDSIDVYVQTSRSEGFGLSVIEAMSQNIPVAVTPAGSLKEIVKNGVTGYIAKDFSIKNISKTMSLAVGDYELSKRIGEAGGRYVRDNFATDKWINETEKTYKEACL